jgi:pimeloyl-ACP methyl ester carboxylesterase
VNRRRSAGEARRGPVEARPKLADVAGNTPRQRAPVPARARWRVVVVAAVLLGALGLIEACAASNVRRARKDRRPLGGRLYVERAGPLTAPAMVYLSGITGTTTYWREAGVLRLADEGFRVLLVDPLGLGRSPWPDAEYTLEDHLAALDRTLAFEGVRGDVILVGHSFGALLAVEHGARHADSVRQAILFGTPIYRSEVEARQRIGEMSALAGLTARGSPMARLLCDLHTALPNATVRLAPLFRRDLPAAVVADGGLHSWKSFRGSLENVVIRHRIEPAVSTLGAGVTFVHGRLDGITALERVGEVAAASGASVIVTGDSHVSYWRNARNIVRSRALSGRPTPPV